MKRECPWRAVDYTQGTETTNTEPVAIYHCGQTYQASLVLELMATGDDPGIMKIGLGKI